MSFDAIAVPGGPGHKHIGESKELQHIVTTYFKTPGKIVAAICAAPTYLGKWGILTEKKATCYPGMERGLHCRTFSTDNVVIDGNVITSRGPGTAWLFGLTLIEVLCGKATKDQVAVGAVSLF